MGHFTSTVTNLELRASNPDGSEGVGLTHSSGGLFLLHVLELAGEGEPRGGVAILHGAGDHGERYRLLAETLAADGWAAALPDMRGHGRSEGERGHSGGIPEAVRDIESVLDHLAYRLPDAPKVLLGQGLGALQCLIHTLEYPDRVSALILVAPLLRPTFELPPPPRGLRKLLGGARPTDLIKLGHRAEQMSAEEDERRAWVADDLVHDAISVGAARSALEAAERARARVAEIGVPTLILHGTSDSLADARESERLAGDSIEVDLLDGLGHDLFHESGASGTIERVRSWLDATLPRSPVS